MSRLFTIAGLALWGAGCTAVVSADELMEEETQSYSFAQWTNDDDDGPYAA